MSAPLTAAQLADALSHFSNDAITAMHNGTADVACIASGLQAVAWRLETLAAEKSSATDDTWPPSVGDVYAPRQVRSVTVVAADDQMVSYTFDGDQAWFLGRDEFLRRFEKRSEAQP